MIVGQDRAVAEFQGAWRAGTLHHAWLLSGPKGVGKAAFARAAATRLLGGEASVASLRGRVHRYEGIPLVVTYHPAYLLRTPVDKAKAWQDLLFARRTLREAS